MILPRTIHMKLTTCRYLLPVLIKCLLIKQLYYNIGRIRLDHNVLFMWILTSL